VVGLRHFGQVLPGPPPEHSTLFGRYPSTARRFRVMQFGRFLSWRARSIQGRTGNDQGKPGAIRGRKATGLGAISAPVSQVAGGHTCPIGMAHAEATQTPPPLTRLPGAADLVGRTGGPLPSWSSARRRSFCLLRQAQRPRADTATRRARSARPPSALGRPIGLARQGFQRASRSTCGSPTRPGRLDRHLVAPATERSTCRSLRASPGRPHTRLVVPRRRTPSCTALALSKRTDSSSCPLVR
jgi:hypothetical protein